LSRTAPPAAPAGHDLGVEPKLFALSRLRAAGYTDAEVRRMHRAGDLTRLRSGIYLAKPVLQWEVRRRDGTFVGEVDFGWPELRTVGEFDGKVKYGVLVRPGEDPADVLYREKLREDAIRAEVLGVVRWGWRNLWDFTPVANRLRQRFGWTA
jgi:hypothetical protein